MSVIAELSLFPIGKEESLAPYAVRAIQVIRQSGLNHTVGPMGTCIEGEYDAVMAVVRDCYKALEADCPRIYMTLKVDARKGRENGLANKMTAVGEQP